MKNILVVDFDIIMYPCIKLYEQYIGSKDYHALVWDNLENRMEISHYLKYDAHTLQNIVTTFKHCGAIVQGIREADNIVSLIDEPVTMTYVGQYHGLGYSNADLETVEHFEQYDATNWALYLTKKELVADYKWLKAPNSEIPTLVNPSTVYKITDFNQLEGPYDEVYFVQSPLHVPYQYQHLYYLILSIFKED